MSDRVISFLIKNNDESMKVSLTASTQVDLSQISRNTQLFQKHSFLCLCQIGLCNVYTS